MLLEKFLPDQRLFALRGAKSSAYRKMAELIKGLYTPEGKTLTDTIKDPKTFESKIGGLVRGGTFSRPSYSDDGATVTLKVPLSRVEKVLGYKILYPKKPSHK